VDRAARATRLRREDGFGLIEAVVALVIIFGMVLVLMRTLDSTVRVLVETRRASAANSFATELIERAQALEWRHMGLAASTNGTDCATGQVGCATHLTEFPDLASDGTGGWTLDGEAVIFTSSDTFKPFLDFHQRVERDGTEFDRYIFVTSVDEDADGYEDFRRLTAVVRWVPPTGFQRSVEQSTLVTPFSRPRQPLIRTDVSYAGGSVDITGLNEPGAVATGSRWVDLLERDQFEAGLTLPSFGATALSDYVSEGQVRIEGASIPHLAWAGADGIMGTADDERTVLDPVELSVLSDDDPLSTAPTALPLTMQVAPGVVHGDPYPKDLLLVQLGRTEPLLGGAASDGLMTARAAAHDDAGAADGLPYAEASFEGSDKTVIGFLEYGDVASQTLYATHWGAAFPLSEFGFSMFRRQDRGGSAVPEVSGTADRILTGDDQTVTGDLKFTSPSIELLRDDVIDQAVGGSGFNGWVVIDPPSISVSGVTAGESALAVPDPVNAGNLRVRVWDPVGEAYVVTTVAYDNHGGSCDAVPAPVVVPVGAPGAPLTAEVLTSPLPWLTYEVEGSVTINPWCIDSDVDTDDPTLVTTSLWETVGPMVVVSLNYRVLDHGPKLADPTADPIDLFDLTLDVVTDTMRVTSVFSEPS
jgi:type II secretory pathway pseudopilin PulG